MFLSDEMQANSSDRSDRSNNGLNRYGCFQSSHREKKKYDNARKVFLASDLVLQRLYYLWLEALLSSRYRASAERKKEIRVSTTI